MKRLVLALLLCLPATSALGWGREGHRIVAELAQRELQPQVRAEVDRLLADEAEPTLPGVANWADELRKAEAASSHSSWHYVNFRAGDCDYVPARDCPGDECVIAAIEQQLRVLSDRARPDGERRDALKLLVHFVADVHQPLHASPRQDKGGGDYQVNLSGRGSNLHAVWDREIIGFRGLEPEGYADALAAQAPLPPDPAANVQRPAVEWALESCRLVRDGNLYPDSHVLGPDYLPAHRALAEQRLRQAGVRLASVINHALAPTP